MAFRGNFIKVWCPIILELFFLINYFSLSLHTELLITETYGQTDRIN